MRMIEEGRDCEEVLVQIAAIRSALKKVMVDRLRERLMECIKEGKSEEQIKKDFARTLDRLLRFID